MMIVTLAWSAALAAASARAMRLRAPSPCAGDTETFASEHPVLVEAEVDQRIGHRPDHRVRAADERVGGFDASAEVLVEFADLVTVEPAGRNRFELLVFLAEHEVQLQALRENGSSSAYRSSMNIVVDCVAVAVEEHEAALRFVLEYRLDHREYRRDTAACGETDIVFARCRDRGPRESARLGGIALSVSPTLTARLRRTPRRRLRAARVRRSPAAVRRRPSRCYRSGAASCRRSLSRTAGAVPAGTRTRSRIRQARRARFGPNPGSHARCAEMVSG